MDSKGGNAMKRIFLLIIIMILCTGCSGKGKALNSEEEFSDSKENIPDAYIFEAIVLSKESKSLSVFVTEEGKGFRKFDPVNVSYDTSQLDVLMGDIVEISYNGIIAESYPSQIGADNIEIKEKVENNWPATSSIPDDYTVEAAIQDNCFVVTLDKVEANERLNSFIENTKAGIIGLIRRISYTIEGDPIITDIIFDGIKYYVFEDSTRDKFASDDVKIYKKEYLYVNTYEKENYQTIYLANRDDITATEYEKSLNSSNSEDYLDIYPLN